MSTIQTSDKTTEQAPVLPQVPGAVVAKLVMFSIAMLALPLITYFVSTNVFKFGTYWAAGFTVAMVHLVLFAYIVVAVIEDRSTAEDVARHKKSLANAAAAATGEDDDESTTQVVSKSSGGASKRRSNK
ncbi:hypothetical protein H696_06016 [Fonticula alba]|uniref:Vacuolar ATPase assembly integral membrane protein VMA21 n=1 Tax=Fonticula alba TaxID=691883 RepID=A0A058Z071_FONAL|nr:hypothetical protein H696_06016 [Fonticula alba]KCV67496.1 hypothetical protein H696_06016 [Fonticula alba]|eukprot:XP_009498057.1 hypothetical protein H696_06016 [Fonticula alba]